VFEATYILRSLIGNPNEGSFPKQNLLDKMIIYMKDEKNNISILTRALTFGVTCAPLALKAP
jgi:hypothetical protein